MLELKNCPFCGTDVHWCDCGNPNGEGCHQITCPNCGQFDFGTNDVDGETMEELRENISEKWNRRHSLPH